MHIKISVQEAAFDVGDETLELGRVSKQVGAITSFITLA